MAGQIEEHEYPSFTLQDYYPDSRPVKELDGLIESGKLPFDTLFRLASIGRVVDDATRSTYLNFTMMLEMIECDGKLDLMRESTRRLLTDELPDAIVDINSGHNHPFYSLLDPVYYRMMDLARTIHFRRVAQGKNIPDESYKIGTGLKVPQDEWSRCRALASPIWKLMVNRFHPEWLENPDIYYPNGYIGGWGSSTYYEYGIKKEQRGIVSHAVFSDPLVRSFYEEICQIGVDGIGPVGREDLRLLLKDEHPELMEGHELPK